MFVCTLNNFAYTFIAGVIVGGVFVALSIYYTIKKHGKKDETDKNI